MIQLNLLPDVKLEFVQARQRKRAVVGLSAIVSAVFLALFVFLLLFVRVAQKQHLSALDTDINKSVETLKSTPDLDKILTIQNQLNSLPNLHDDKVISSRTFDYLNQLTPTQATISDINLDFETNTLTIKGNSDALSTVNKFADTLKFSSYKVSGDKPSEGKAFNNVVLANFAVQNGGTVPDKAVSYELTMNFEAVIFANLPKTSDGQPPISLSVPQIISTRSATQVPKALFSPQPGSEGAR